MLAFAFRYNSFNHLGAVPSSLGSGRGHYPSVRAGGQPRGKYLANLPQMPPPGGGIRMGFHFRNHLFGPGLSPGLGSTCSSLTRLASSRLFASVRVASSRSCTAVRLERNNPEPNKSGNACHSLQVTGTVLNLRTTASQK